MKVQKFEQIPDPGYPSHRQFSECKALLGAAMIGLGGVVMAADEPPVIKGKVRAEPAAVPAVPVAKPVPKPVPQPQIDGGIRVEPKPAPPPKLDPPRIAGEIVAEPKTPVPPPKPAK